MKVACFSTKPYDRHFLSEASESSDHTFQFFEPRLDESTAVLAEGSEAVCAFVNDSLGAATLGRLAETGVRFIVLRCAGFNNVDLEAAAEHDIRVARVPRYSPHAVAEHTVGLLLTLNRKIHKAYNRVRENNFSIDGLLGFDLHQKTFGVIGTGTIGQVLVQIMAGFGCEILMHDPYPVDEAKRWGSYVDLDDLLRRSDVVSLQCPLTPETHHLVNAARVAKMKSGAILINTSRGGLVDTTAAINGLKSKQLGGFALDVYEEETGVFFEDLSQQVVQDDVLSRLLTFPNVLVTSHQAFFTREALETIAQTTIQNLDEFATAAEDGGESEADRLENEVAASSP